MQHQNYTLSGRILNNLSLVFKPSAVPKELVASCPVLQILKKLVYFKIKKLKRYRYKPFLFAIVSF
uniref:Uncharacterized protein n=1 Tax=Meloidogyne incognita TaxID=6306 RepID=A0A914KHZ6_MELIC